MKSIWTILLLAVVASCVDCGGGKKDTASNNPLSGNWQISLQRHLLPNDPLLYSGFILQDGDSVTGSFILGSNCDGVGRLNGTLNGQNLSLALNEFGQEISLTGTAPPSGESMSGNFSTLAGGCTDFPNTGTWSAVRVPTLGGSFHGTFASTNLGTFDVTGTLTQGPNTGGSTATLSGIMNASGADRFCSYLTAANITGVISGTVLSLNLYGPNGAQITQIPGSLTPDGASMTGTYTFQTTSKTCLGDQGTVRLIFP